MGAIPRVRRWVCAVLVGGAVGCGGAASSMSGMPPVCSPPPWSGDEVPRLRVPFDAVEDPAVGAAGLSAVPSLLNEAEVQSALIEEFVPVVLDEDPVPEGIVRYWLLVGADGDVSDVERALSSGNDRVDQAADRVVRMLELTPAVRGRCRVPVWIHYPIRFERGGRGS